MSLSALYQIVREMDERMPGQGARWVQEHMPQHLLPIAPWCWPLWARPEQLAPLGSWTKWLALAGRGFGKTRLGVEWVLEYLREHPGARVALVGRTAADVRSTMLYGDSGLLTKSHPSDQLQHVASKRLVIHANGAQCETFSADEPRQLRGPQHHAAWADELAAWDDRDAWDQLMFGLRLEWQGQQPRVVITTTPRPISVIRELVADPTCVVTRGSTYDNRSNLAPAFFTDIVRRFEGTRLGRQELNAEVLEDVAGALWNRSQIDRLRVRSAPELERVVVGVDPATTSGEDSDATGIVVAGLGADGHGYVLADYTMRGTPEEWAQQVVQAYHRHSADLIVAERNQGGEMVEATIRHVDAVPVKTVHARKGKTLRSEPVAMLYEQNRVHHVGALDALEDQLCQLALGPLLEKARSKSPDRADAMVYALTELFQSERVAQEPAIYPRRQEDEMEQRAIERLNSLRVDNSFGWRMP